MGFGGYYTFCDFITIFCQILFIIFLREAVQSLGALMLERNLHPQKDGNGKEIMHRARLVQGWAQHELPGTVPPSASSGEH